MKITISTSIAAAIAFSAVTIDAAASTVNLEVACKGIDYGTLSAKALSFSAKALESTFNSVHKDMDGTTLTSVAATGTLIGSGLLRGADSALTFSGKEAPLKGQDSSIDDFVSSSRLSVRLDSQSSRNSRKIQSSRMYQMCRLCGGDDAAAGLVDASKRKAWESLFAASISSGPHAAFKGASQCSIKVRSNDANQMVALESNVPVGVEVDVHCDNVNFADLSVRGIAASSHALKETYNSIHQALDGSKLGNVVMAGNRLRVGDLSIDDFVSEFPAEQAGVGRLATMVQL